MDYRLLILIPLLHVFLLTTLHSSIIHVPSEQPTIQAGIDAAFDSDTVLVADGIFTGYGNQDIDFLGKAIVVMSENGSVNCILNLGGSMNEPHRGFLFNKGEDSTSVLRGFTIRNGRANGGWPENCGGAILCSDSSPVIIDNIITGNRACCLGGGIFCFRSSPIIKNNTIKWNMANHGGGIHCDSLSTPIIIDNNIVANAAIVSEKGGFDCGDLSIPIVNDRFGKDLAKVGYGGAICCINSSPMIKNNHIEGNTAEFQGGVFWDTNSSPLYTDNTGTNPEGYGRVMMCILPNMESLKITVQKNPMKLPRKKVEPKKHEVCIDTLSNARNDSVGYI